MPKRSLVGSIVANACPHCLHFECKNNQVPESVRRAYEEAAAG